jgi:hypothetical protein
MLVTMFLLNEESDRLRTEPASMFRFANEFGVYALGRKHPPENAVAYREDYVRGLFNAHGLDPNMFYGSWCGRAEHTDFQDIIVATRGAHHPYDGSS